jgi:hypothetical protein
MRAQLESGHLRDGGGTERAAPLAPQNRVDFSQECRKMLSFDLSASGQLPSEPFDGCPVRAQNGSRRSFALRNQRRGRLKKIQPLDEA